MADEADQAAGYVDADTAHAINRARATLGRGESSRFCDECGDPIPERRRKALPGVRTCVGCQEIAERR